MVKTGFSAVIGSWKIMPISLPRIFPHRGGIGAGEVDGPAVGAREGEPACRDPAPAEFDEGASATAR